MTQADAVATGLLTFPGLAHRMETIGIIGSVRFVNDSKATNVDAARQAMSAYPRFRWIAGGRAKEGGIEPLADLFGSVTKAYLVGEASAKDFAANPRGAQAPAVELGTTWTTPSPPPFAARAGRWREEAIVLFSPACASFDQYSDFEARGEAFRAAVHALA